MGVRTFGFGLARSLDFHTSLARFSELCEILSAAVGQVFYPHHALSYSELSNGLARGDLGLAWMPPIPALDLEDKKAAELLVVPVRRGTTLFHSAIIVAPGAYASIADLRGARAGWVDRDSAAGYLFPRLHVGDSGFQADAFFGQESFLGSHIAVVDAVVSGRVDVGGTFCKIESGTGRIANAAWTDGEGKPLRDVDVLATLGPIPNDVILASSKLSSDLRKRVLRWFLDPASARAMEIFAELLRAESCRAPTPSHYEPLRRMIGRSIARGDTPWRASTVPPPVKSRPPR